MSSAEILPSMSSVYTFWNAQCNRLSSLYFQWYPEIRDHCPTQPIMIVGCGTDLRTDESVLEKLSRKKLAPVTYEQVRALNKNTVDSRYLELAYLE